MDASSILLVGLSHHTAPITVRERFSFDANSLRSLLCAFRNDGEEESVLQEVIVLATCNRLEVYAVSLEPTAAHQIVGEIARQRNATQAELTPYVYIKTGQAAIEHLLHVASGLDSLILGEAQILGQVADAYASAQANGGSGPILARLFHTALHCGKRARRETAIGSYTTSISHAAVKQARALLGDLSHRTALILGAGEMAELAAAALNQHQIASLFCINRTQAHAERLAAQVGGCALEWRRLDEALATVDLVISATAAPSMILTAATVAQAMGARNGRPLVLFDIAHPRDIDPNVDALPGVMRFDLDHLQHCIDANLGRRQAAIPQVKAIIAEESAAFMEWLAARDVAPTVVALRTRSEAIARQEVERTLRKLLHEPPEDERLRQEVERLANRIVAKLLHEPTVRLKARAATGDGACFARALTELFGLEAAAPTSSPADARGCAHPLFSASNGAALFCPEHCNGVYCNGVYAHE
ncbi:MAG: glutamyl-tRNA reductase [Caldilinea sp.]|nr:glutamyl-tRNA reductase [Caldilinea sp.]MDW8441634.1 glutamyl-tRNA reductase [Caldilineaceae bacterium]